MGPLDCAICENMSYRVAPNRYAISAKMYSVLVVNASEESCFGVCTPLPPPLMPRTMPISGSRNERRYVGCRFLRPPLILPPVPIEFAHNHKWSDKVSDGITNGRSQAHNQSVLAGIGNENTQQAEQAKWPREFADCQ